MYHEDLEKLGGVLSGGAREAREPSVALGWLLPKDTIFSNLPAFQDLKIDTLKSPKTHKRIKKSHIDMCRFENRIRVQP